MIKTTFLGSVYKPELNIIGDIIITVPFQTLQRLLHLMAIHAPGRRVLSSTPFWWEVNKYNICLPVLVQVEKN